MKAPLSPRRDGLPPAALLIALLALPQAAETILAPALPDLARHWRLDAALTQSVMGIYFLGFAAGVLLWGWLCDAWGRRPALLAGLCTGLAGTLCAAWAPGFEALLAGRFVQALGLATCSITTQTMLRDRLQGEALTRCFIMLGAVLSWSPALGPLAGQLLADQAGFRGVLGGIAALAGLLLAAGWARVGETRTAPAARQPMLRLARRMLRDPELLCTAMLVAGLNLLAFSFYAAGPFMTGPLPWLGFGWIGMAVALAGTLGALWNRRLPASQGPARRVALGLRCVAVGVAAQGLAIWLAPMPGLWWAVAALPIFAGYGMAIPNLLGPALRRYGDCLGRAGALFSLGYYSLLGLLLAATSWLPFGSPVPLALAWAGVTLALAGLHRLRGRLT